MKHLHIIGICGVATSAIGIAFHKAGWKVTGSDKGFYPPVSTYLTEAGVSYYAGWHPEKMIAAGLPDLIMTGGGGTSPSNPEAICAVENNIPIETYAEVLQKYFVKKNSIVIAGTWGKTTSSSLLSFILIKAGLNPSYFTGGLSLSHDTGHISDSNWSVLEGDEYQVSISNKLPKFAYYEPTHLLLTSVSWDHADLYPTEASYFDTFKKLVEKIPTTGKIVACIDNSGVQKTLSDSSAQSKVGLVTTYGAETGADYRYHSISHTKKGISFSVMHAGKDYIVESPMLGRFNAENIAGCFAMAHQIGIEPTTIISAIKEFKGIKRRFEKRLDGDIAGGNGKGVTVIDCHAPTPEKAAAALESVREIYDKQIIAIYEPNIGGRQRESIAMYNNAFKNADRVFIPRLTKTKVDLTDTDKKKAPIEGEELASYISTTHPATHYVEDDALLVDSITANAKKDDVIVFLGSHGFRGMIEETIKKLENKEK